MKFIFEHRIRTLAENACAPSHRSFQESGIQFSHWDFTLREGWRGGAWLARGEVEEGTFQRAAESYFDRFLKVVRRVAFIGQTYTEAWTQPWLATREGFDLGYFRYAKETEGAGLMFMESEARALRSLMLEPEIPEEFFFYWNDAVNTPGYSAKLLLMFSALEALAKTPSREKDREKLGEILGSDLNSVLFGTKDNSRHALRNRLVHGEYFSIPDSGVNYVEKIHAAVLGYFNREFLQQDPLRLVVRPQRHFFGNRVETRLFLTPKNGRTLDLKNVLSEFDEKGIDHFDGYLAVWDEGKQRAFLGEETVT